MSQVQYPVSKNIWYRHHTVHKTTHKISVLSISNRKPHPNPSITTDQSKKVHSLSNRISVASTDQNTNRPSPQVSDISHTENPPESRKKAVIRHKQSASGLQKLPLKPKYLINW